MSNIIKSPDTLQHYVSIGIVLHPVVLKSFYQQLVDMECKKQLALLPRSRLEYFSLRVGLSIEQKFEQAKKAA